MDARIAALLTVTFLFPVAAAALSGAYSSAIVMEERSGEILFAENEHARLAPASMVKMMTELVVFEHIARGEVTFDDPVTVSARASRIGGSQVYLKEGEVFTVHDLMMALAIHSGNDAGVALAEHVAGTDDAFVVLMNERARELGMRDTVFHSVHGLPPARGQSSDLSSAHDMALLGRELCRHPEALSWAVMDQVPFRNGQFLLRNPNPLVGKLPGLEGIKTGYTVAAGFCLTAAATQKGVRLISVVMGAKTNTSRGAETSRLLARGFTEYSPVKLVPAAGDSCPRLLAVKGGKLKTAGLVFTQPLVVGVRKARAGDVTLRYELPDRIEAPAAVGTVIGKAVAELDGRPLGEVPIALSAAVAKGSFWDRIFRR
jgi:D-alanyl-D-alanine carboxypeptidase (penicillin-binding protein 5/6)